jgi:hypothetical protein
VLVDVTCHSVFMDPAVCPSTLVIRTRQIEDVSTGILKHYYQGVITTLLPIIQVDREEAGVYVEYRIESEVLAQKILGLSFDYPISFALKAESAIWAEKGWKTETVSLHVRGPMRPRGCELILAGKRPVSILCPDYDPISKEATPLMLGDNGDLCCERLDCWARLVGDDDIIAAEACSPET